MRKCIILPIVALVLTNTLYAQDVTPAENKSLSRKVDSFLARFIEVSAFSPDKHQSVNEATEQKFLDLFKSPAAEIDDYSDYNKLSKSYTGNDRSAIITRTAEGYARFVRDSFPGGMKVKRSFTSYTSAVQNGTRVKGIVCRKVKGETVGKQQIEFTDTLELSLESGDTNYHFLIAGVRIIHSEQMAAYGNIVVKKSSFYLRRGGEIDALNQKFFVSFGPSFGTYSQALKGTDMASRYTNAVNADIGNPTFKGGSNIGFDLQLEYYIGESGRFGVGTGLSYAYQQGQITLDKFHVEYQSTDANSRIFRQIVTANGPITENIKENIMNIPVLLKVKIPLSARLGFMMDAGVLFNVFSQASYSTNASFDYEAAYQFVPQGNNYVAVYDNQPALSSNDWLITKSQNDAHNTSGQTTQQYFDELAGQGYNVGINKNAGNNSTLKYNPGAVGFLVQPSISYKLNENVYLLFGIYYSLQSFSPQSNDNTSRLTDKVGTYNPIVNAADKSKNSSFGVHIGAKIW